MRSSFKKLTVEYGGQTRGISEVPSHSHFNLILQFKQQRGDGKERVFNLCHPMQGHGSTKLLPPTQTETRADKSISFNHRIENNPFEMPQSIGI